MGQSSEELVVRATEEDWGLVEGRIKEAYDQELDKLSMGELVAQIGLTFLGTPYASQTLDPIGDEALVVELETLDCVTFVETVLALARVVNFLDVDDYRRMSKEQVRNAYSERLVSIRYREGQLDGYASRLHYFSEWIEDNSKLGLVEEVVSGHLATTETEPIDFMTTHPGAYWQLRNNPALVAEIQEMEANLSAKPRPYVREKDVDEIEPDLLNGDIIAATSSIEGLDVAHTGIAIWKEGRVHLLHAPLAGGVVQVSERPLAERILALGGQDGVMIARPIGR
tara:strand:- start:51 stop:899 length:849 start_codon:yes stop_codon:yes gene_type:complete